MDSAISIDARALETLEKVIASLRRYDERDEVVERVIRDIEDMRASLLARVMSARRRP